MVANLGRFSRPIRMTILAVDVMAACALCVFFLDLRLEQFIFASRDRFSELASLVIPDMGSAAALAATAVPFCALMFLRSDGIRANRTLLLLGTVATAHASCGLLKFLFGRARPELFFADGVYSFDFFRWDYAFHSFPSGHAAVCAGLAMAASLIDRTKRWTILAVGLAIANVPVVTGVHYLSDAILGVGIGVVSAIVAAGVLKRCELPVEEAAP